MKASQFSDAQKAFILKQGAEGHPVAEICRRVAEEVEKAKMEIDAIFYRRIKEIPPPKFSQHHRRDEQRAATIAILKALSVTK